MADRQRRDQTTRDRVDEIGASMESYRERLDARYRKVVAFVMVLMVLVLAIGAAGWNSARNTGDALCAFRVDIDRRVDSSQKFLRDHPNGVQGISRTDIEVGIRNQQRTIASLSNLSC